MNTARVKNSVLVLLSLLLAATLAVGLCAHPEPEGMQRPARTAPAPVPAHPAASHAAGGATLADAAARLELAGAYRPADWGARRDLAAEVLPDAYADAQWHNVSPFSAETGRPQRGWVAKDLFTALDYESNPQAFGGELKYAAHQLSIFPEDGFLNAQIALADGPVVEYQWDAFGNPYTVLNVVFDFPSNHHKYMQLIGRPGTRGGIIIDATGAPELLAQVMTSTYMRIFIPLAGQSKPAELMFYNEPFKGLLEPDERATATAAMEKADRESAQARIVH